MEVDAESQLSRVLSTEELEKLPPDIIKKLEEYFVSKLEEYITSKALCETAKRNIGEYKFFFSFVYTFRTNYRNVNSNIQNLFDSH